MSWSRGGSEVTVKLWLYGHRRPMTGTGACRRAPSPVARRWRRHQWHRTRRPRILRVTLSNISDSAGMPVLRPSAHNESRQSVGCNGSAGAAARTCGCCLPRRLRPGIGRRGVEGSEGDEMALRLEAAGPVGLESPTLREREAIQIASDAPSFFCQHGRTGAHVYVALCI